MAELTVSGRFMQVKGLVLQPKSFSSGSKGWYAGGKFATEEGIYQCNFQAVIVGSKDDPTCPMPTDDLMLGDQAMVAKTFSTGSTGFFSQGKIMTKHGSLQCQFQAVLVGSKPVTEEGLKAKFAAQDARREKADAEREAKRQAQLAALKGA